MRGVVGGGGVQVAIFKGKADNELPYQRDRGNLNDVKVGEGRVKKFCKKRKGGLGKAKGEGRTI